MILLDISRKKKKAYLKAKIQKLQTTSDIKNIRDLYRGISDFKKGYEPRTNVGNDENSDLVADPYSIVARWRNYFSTFGMFMGLMILRNGYTQQNH